MVKLLFSEILLKRVQLFLHHIEEKAKVTYRFYKFFKGEIIGNKKKKKLNVSYYVRKLSLNTQIKFKKTLF